VTFWIARFLALIFFLQATMNAQDQRHVPAVYLSSPHRVLALKANDACAIDFANTRMFGENKGWAAPLKNGKYEHKYDAGYDSVTLDHVYCVHRDASKVSYALAVTNWLSCGGSCMSTGVVQVIAVRDGRPFVTQQLTFDSHAPGTGATYDECSHTLTITGRSDDDSPNCCAKNFDVVTMQWQGSKFAQNTYRRIPAPPPQPPSPAP